MFLIEWPPFEYTVLLTIIGKISTKVNHATSDSKFFKIQYTNTMHIVLHVNCTLCNIYAHCNASKTDKNVGG